MHMHMDNESAIFMDIKLVTINRFKHTGLRYHVKYDYINKDIVKLNYVNTKHNIAGIAPKSTYKLNHARFAGLLLQDKETTMN